MDDVDRPSGPPPTPPPPPPRTGARARHRRGTPPGVAWAWLLVALAAAAAFAALGGTETDGGDATAFLYAVAGAGVLVAAAGVVANHPTRAAGWWLVVLGTAIVLAGPVLREATDLAEPDAALDGAWPALVGAAGYVPLALGAWLVAGRRGRAGVDSALDALAAGLAGFAAAWVLFVEPAADRSERADLEVVCAALAPVLALVVVVLVLDATGARERRLPACWLLLASSAALLVASAGWAAVLSGRTDWSTTPFDTAYLVAAALVGATTLHPTMRRLGVARSVLGPEAPARRAAVGVLLLLVPLVSVALADSLDTAGTIAVLAAGGALAVVGAWRVWRAVGARVRVDGDATSRYAHDPLTGLVTRGRFEDEVADALALVRPGCKVAVVVGDLDRFRSVNDGLGHAVGDEVLVGVSRRLREVVDPSAVLARIGGDAFALLVREVSAPEDLRLATDALLALGDEPVGTSAGEVFVSFSLGVATGGGEASAADLLRDADTALERAKGGERGSAAVFDPGMREAALARVTLETNLRRAVERGELVLHYQPVVRLATGGVVGFEALVRWGRPDGELLAPDQFLPIAEDTGTIVELGRWVLREAIRQLAVWQTTVRGASGLFMSINLSPRQLRHPSLPAVLAGALGESGVPPATVWVEVTEGALADEASRTLEAFTALRHLGVWLSLDNVGTAYPSLQHLGRLPVDRVKIDRSQVAGLGEGGQNARMVATLVSMAHSLGMSVVAEGIETLDQRHALVDVGCEMGQGFLFSRPLPADEIPGAVSGRIGLG